MAERSAATPQTVQPVTCGAALRGLTPPPMKREFARSRRWRRQGAVWIASPLELRRTAIHERGRDVRCLRDCYFLYGLSLKSMIHGNIWIHVAEEKGVKRNKFIERYKGVRFIEMRDMFQWFVCRCRCLWHCWYLKDPLRWVQPGALLGVGGVMLHSSHAPNGEV
nr:uncharacterized protein LOC127311405 [Lolium perenne]